MSRRHGGLLIDDAFTALAEAAKDRAPVAGWTHNFYRYPARFSPRFAAAAIESFSKPGALILDPYMGGGTAVVEAAVAGRRAVGNDLNSLAAFIAKVKVTGLATAEVSAIRRWAAEDVPGFSFYLPRDELAGFIDPQKTRNLALVRSRFIKKVVAAALASIVRLPTPNAKDFARCVVLRVGQWALDGRKRHTPLSEFRARLTVIATEMLDSLAAFAGQARSAGGKAVVLNGDASNLPDVPLFQEDNQRADLVVTSPPYPGVHVLYHRWQVDGRRETPAPYWIAGCNDGEGASFYNFGDRRETAADTYFRRSLLTLQAIRRVVRRGGYMVQMVAFNRPDDQLPRYLNNMQVAGFREISVGSGDRIWRQVPNRKWHASRRRERRRDQEASMVAA